MKKPLRTSGYHEPPPSLIKAITIKKISGSAIKTIPIGTEFMVSYIHKDHSFSHGICIDQIWNDEYELVNDIEEE